MRTRRLFKLINLAAQVALVVIIVREMRKGIERWKAGWEQAQSQSSSAPGKDEQPSE